MLAALWEGSGGIWEAKVHEVMFSSRHPEKIKALAESAGRNASFGLSAEAAKFGNVIALAVPWARQKMLCRPAPLKIRS